jgi:hypothetical protein
MSYNKITILRSADGIRCEFSQLGARWTVMASPDVVDALCRAARRDDVVSALESEMGRRGGNRDPFVADGPYPTEAPPASARRGTP